MLCAQSIFYFCCLIWQEEIKFQYWRHMSYCQCLAYRWRKDKCECVLKIPSNDSDRERERERRLLKYSKVTAAPRNRKACFIKTRRYKERYRRNWGHRGWRIKAVYYQKYMVSFLVPRNYIWDAWYSQTICYSSLISRANAKSY